eukprot:1176776-Prorocentrum_minimum.AAC.1
MACRIIESNATLTGEFAGHWGEFAGPWAKGSASDVIGSVSDVIGSVSDVIGSVSDVIGSMSDVIGSVSDVIGSVSDVIGSVSDVIGSARRFLTTVTRATYRSLFIQSHNSPTWTIRQSVSRVLRRAWRLHLTDTSPPDSLQVNTREWEGAAIDNSNDDFAYGVAVDVEDNTYATGTARRPGAQVGLHTAVKPLIRPSPTEAFGFLPELSRTPIRKCRR